MNRPRRFRRSILALGLLVSIPGATRAANLIHNPSFTGGLAPWTQSASSTVAFDALDAAGVPGSGSVKVTSILGGSIASTVHQCVAIDPSVHYRFRADALFPTGQAPADLSAFLFRYPTTNCT